MVGIIEQRQALSEGVYNRAAIEWIGDQGEK
jgi:hypothetical protein